MTIDSERVPWWAGFRMLTAMAVIEAAALVPFRYLPTEDGPTNIASAHIINRYPGPYSRYFKLDFLPKFDMLWQLTLSAAARVMPTLVAERIMLVALVIGLPLAGWYAARGIRDDGGPAAFLLLPLAIGWFFHAGYHSFCLGVVLCLLAVGWWLRHRDGRRREHAVLALLLVLSYLAHVVAFGMAVGFITVVIGWEDFTGEHDNGKRRLAALFAAAVPATALLAFFIARGTGESGVGRLSPTTLVKNLVTLRPVFGSFDSREAAPSLLVALTFVGVGVFVLLRATPRDWRHRDHAWLVATVATVLLYFLAPANVGSGGQINERIAVYLVVVGTLWFASVPRPRRLTGLIVGVSLVAGMALTVLHLPKYADFNDDLREFTSVGDHLPDGATVAPVFLVQSVETHDGLAQSNYVRPVIQATGYLVDERNIVDLSQFNGQFKFFITQFRDDVDPLKLIGKNKVWLDESPPDVDLSGYDRATGGRGRIDYVIVWGLNDAGADVTSSPTYRSLRAQIDAGFELVFTSDRGHAQLYRRR